MAGSGSDKDKSAERAALPFEPNKKTHSKVGSKTGNKAKDRPDKAKKPGKGRTEDSVSAKAQARVDEIRASNRRKAEAKRAQASGKKTARNRRDESSAIPPEVSRRMLRRMAVFSGSPIALGVGIFFLSYYLLSNQIVTFAPVLVLLVTMGCFGLGVLGLTYGVLSASWDEEPGSLIGIKEFQLNFGRAVEGWRASKES